MQGAVGPMFPCVKRTESLLLNRSAKFIVRSKLFQSSIDFFASPFINLVCRIPGSKALGPSHLCRPPSSHYCSAWTSSLRRRRASGPLEPENEDNQAAARKAEFQSSNQPLKEGRQSKTESERTGSTCTNIQQQRLTCHDDRYFAEKVTCS